MQVVAYRYKVYSQNRNHRKRLEEFLRTAAWIYNHCIALHRRYYRLYKKSLPKAKLQSHIARMKKRCYPSWELVNSMAAQEITDRIYSGYDRFFKKEAKRPPAFRNWRKYRSVTFKSSGWTLDGNVLTNWNVRVPADELYVSGTNPEPPTGVDVTSGLTDDTQSIYNIYRNHMYSLGSKGLNVPDDGGDGEDPDSDPDPLPEPDPDEPDPDDPQDLNTAQDLLIHVNDQWEIIHDMVID